VALILRAGATSMPQRLLACIAYGFALWLFGMIEGSVVLAVPRLAALPELPGISRNLAISLPILAAWALVLPLIARRCIAGAADPEAEGRRVGTAFALTVILLDLLVIAIALQAGTGFFAYGLLWLAYALLVAIPWLVGRRMARAA
jgi:hypothetical protein